MKRALSLLLVLLSLTSPSCRRSVDSNSASQPAPRSFQVKGILRAIDFAGQSVTVEHEDIPNYMPAMTMPFQVKTMSEVEPMKAGDAIEFTMLVTDKAAWIEGVKKIGAGEVRLSQSKPSAPGNGDNVERLKEGDLLPEFHLIDSKGRPITRETFAGRSLILTFIFTRCPIPNFCPLMTSNFQQLQQALTADPATSNAQLLSISFDSEFDSPEVLSKYAAYHTKDTDQWRFASGSEDESRRLTRAFSVTVQPESGTIAHGLATALVGPDGIIRKLWRGNGWTPSEVIESVRAL